MEHGIAVAWNASLLQYFQTDGVPDMDVADQNLLDGHFVCGGGTGFHLAGQHCVWFEQSGGGDGGGKCGDDCRTRNHSDNGGTTGIGGVFGGKYYGDVESLEQSSVVVVRGIVGANIGCVYTSKYIDSRKYLYYNTTYIQLIRCNYIH